MRVRGVLAIAGSLSATASFAGGYSNVYVFGDSLSDVGNIYAATGGAEPPSPPYYDGRFSNGPIWAETLASHFGVTLAPSLLGGTDYAFGGAESGAGYNGLIPNVGTQIGMFQTNVGHFASTDLVTLWAGANDFLDGQTNPSVPVANIQTDINALYALGARNILVPNLPLLGYTPEAIADGQAVQSEFNAASLSFDLGLQSMLQGLRTSDPGINLYGLNAAGLFAGVIADPSAYGINDTTDAYLTSGSTANPNTFLFFDDEHPTAGIHNLIGNAAINAVPEPSAMLALGLGMAALLRRRRL